MQQTPIKITIHDKREGITTSIYVAQLSGDVFRTVENEIFNCRLTLGTEFETRLNKDGVHEIVRITKDSEFVTKRFFLTSQFTESEYRLLGDEVIRQGGYWQVDFKTMATINLPKDCTLDLDKIFKAFNFSPTEIKD